MFKSSDRFWRSAVLYALFIWLGIMVFFPNMLVLLASFLSPDEEYFLSLPLNVRNYELLKDPVLLKIILKSVEIAAATTFFCLIAGYPFAYCIAKAPQTFRPFLLMLVVVPFWTNSLIRNYALIALLSANGMLNSFLMKIGLIDAPLQILYTDWAVLIGMAYTLLPFMILPVFASLEKIDKALIEAARDLGAGSAATFFRIVVPLSFPGIIAGCIMVLLPALSLFYVSDILGGANSVVVGSIIRNKFMIARDWPVGSAISVALTVVMLILLKAYYKSGNPSDEEQTLW